MFMWMLHQLKPLNMKQKENFYVNVTWIETIEYKAKGKCSCECYMNWNYRIKEVEMFMWILHELKLLNIKSRGNCLC
jgi:hypothetical protein